MTPRRRKDETGSGLWTMKVGKVRLRERERGGRVLLCYTDADGRRRAPVAQSVGRIRDRYDRPDPELIDRVRAEAEALDEQLAAARLRKVLEPTRLTFEQGLERYHDPERGGLPTSKSARVHHAAARRYWLLVVDAGTPWNLVIPGDINAAAQRLAKAGKVQTAEKYVRCLRTVYRWLRDQQGLDTLRDPTRTVDLRKLREGYEPARPPYSLDELLALLRVAHEVDPRFRFALIWAWDSGARSAALYRAWRSQIDEPLDLPPTQEEAPFGWARLPAMKGQVRALTFLTWRQRLELVRATWRRWNGHRFVPGWLSEYERRWQQQYEDYPLLPGGDWPRGDVFTRPRAPVSNKTLDLWLREAERRADVPHVRRRGWHGIRRAWANYTAAAADIDTVMIAGAWSDRDMPEQVYVAKQRNDRLARARAAQEQRIEY